MRSNLGRIVLSAFVTGALGFGGSQVFATPAAAQNQAYCEPDWCEQQCQMAGYQIARCMNWQCYCYSNGTWVPV